jgi:epoxyqueuosine reductase
MSRSDSLQLNSRIREEALRLGFFNVGFAPALPLPDGGHFTEWLGKQFHGEMRYMERRVEKRLDPRMVLSNVRSLLVLAMNYYTGEAVSDAPMKGRISRYGWGDDYHLVLGNRLEMLLRFIQTLAPSAHGIWYADTGPVMEKAWGARTAVGWIGKNTNLISRGLGSWFFVGVILLDIELEYDSKTKDFCGKCQRCLESCPTGAIVAPYVLDARRCISYLTIEFRGVIPRSLRPQLGNRIFGCDACQEVCPWNRFAIETPAREFYAMKETLMPDLTALVDISQDEFRQWFKNSPIRRATRDGFVRNVAVALGNTGRSEAVPPLERALQDASPLVRAHAAWALGRIKEEAAFRILESALSKEKNPVVLEEINLALGAPGSPFP